MESAAVRGDCVNCRSNYSNLHVLCSKYQQIALSSFSPLRLVVKYGIICAVFTPFGRGAVVAQLTVNQLVAGSNPAARASEIHSKAWRSLGFSALIRPAAKANHLPYHFSLLTGSVTAWNERSLTVHSLLLPLSSSRQSRMKVPSLLRRNSHMHGCALAL